MSEFQDQPLPHNPPVAPTEGRRADSLRGRILRRLEPHRHVVRALRYRNYRLFFAGQGISLLGTWMQQTTQGWLVAQLSGSKEAAMFFMGVVGFCGQIPSFVVAPFAGVLADHMNRRRLVVITQVLAMAQALVMALLALTGVVAIWHVVMLSLVLGLVNSFDVPIRQSFVVEMVEDKADLTNAIALNSSLFNSARLIGPALAGIIIEAFASPDKAVHTGRPAVGEGICFLLNGLSYIAVIAALLAMKVNAPRAASKSMEVLANIKEGLLYAVRSGPLRAILFQVAVMSLLGMSYAVLMPAIAKFVLHGNAATQGALTSSAGAGALVGALYLAWRKSVRGLGKVMAIAAAMFGAALIGLSLSKTVAGSMALLVFAGFGAMITMASSNSLIQTIVDDDKRGRVMALYTMCFMGTAPFGSLLIGSLASWLGATVALAIGGAGCIMAAAFFAYRLPRLGRMVHPIYVRLGIVPQSVGTVAGPGVAATAEERQYL